MFMSEGWLDPAVADDNWKGCGVAIQFDLEDTVFSGIQVHGLYAGMTLIASNSFSIKDAFRNISIRDCSFHQLAENGIHVVDPGEAVQWSIDVRDCLFDIDPEHQNARRTSPLDGSWDFPGAANGTGVAVWVDGNYLDGSLTVDGCTFANCIDVASFSGVGTEPGLAKINWGHNFVHCDPVAVMSQSASNTGVGVPPAPELGFLYTIVDGDPTAATFRDIKNTCLTASSTIPTSGTYPIGHVVRKIGVSTTTGTIGWQRLTTGNGHVLNTDWVELTI
jgi:hypothetical protein